MQSVIKSSIKTVEEYRHNIKLLKYHLKKQQKLNQTLRYKDAKKHKKQTVSNLTTSKQIHPFYNIVQTVNELNKRMKEMGLLLADVFRMADSNYQGEITKEQFMKTILRLRSNLDEQLINELFYAVDTNLNGLLSSDQYEEFLYAHGGCQSKEAIAFQRKAAQKLAALLKKKAIKLSNFFDGNIDPLGVPQLAIKLKDLKLNSNEVMILLKLWDPSLTGAVRHQVYMKSMENIKQKDEKQIQNQKFEKGIKQFCVILRDKKLNPITIFEQAQADGKPGISPFQLQQGLKRIMPSQTPFQIRKWVNLINLNNDQQITKEEFISAIRSFYSIQQINNFGAQYQKMHPTLKKALTEEEIPAQKIINQLSIAIEDSGLTKAQVFRRIDINHNGLVDKEELLEGLKHMGINVGLIAKVLTVFDRDASGEVALDQWLNILGEDLEMQEIQLPTKPNKEVTKQKQVKKSPNKKTQNNISKQKKNEPLKDKDKNKKTDQGVKKSTKKSTQQVPKSNPKGKATKQQTAEDQMIKLPANVLVSKTGKQAKEKQVSKDNNSKELKEITKKFQSEHEQERQIEVEGVERQIAEKYAKSKSKVEQLFKAATKNQKKGLTLQQFQKCLRQMKLNEQDTDKFQKIYEENLSSNGKFDYQEWLNALPDKYGIQVQNHSEHQEENPRIPQIQSRKELANESYAEDYQDNFQNQSQVRQPTAKRGENKEEFEQVKRLVVQNQVHTEEGYKFSTYIGSQEQLQQLNKVYLPNANKLKQKRTIFKDKSFPAERSSLTDNPASSKIQNVTLLKWKHYSEIYKSPKLFEKGIEPNDIVQGQLGDCYFLCSLAGLAEYNRLIQRLFEYFDIQNGYFLIWLCLDGKWKLIELDGYIPVKPDGKAAVFSRARAGDEQLWVLLLEKAYAKAYGCYQHIVGGQPYQAIKDLSGAPGQSFNHKNKNINLDFIWQKLNYANKMQFIMTCGTDQSDKGQFKLEDHSQSVTTQGLVIGHAYSILDLAVYRGEKLIQLRNPWGTMEWNGPWSDKSKNWTADARAALKYTESKDDGIFWMPFETYFKYYATTAINYLRPNYYYTSQRMSKVKHLVMKIDADSFSHGFVMVAQEDHRKKGLPSNTPYNVCHLIALSCKDGKVIRKISDEKYMYQREGSVQISDVDSKSEIVILINLQNATDFNLCTYANIKIPYQLDEKYESMFQFIENIAQLEQNAKNVQTDQKNTFKSWLTSVGDYAFLVFKNITKKQLNITVELQKPSNLKLLESSTTKKMKIKPGDSYTIKGKIIDAKQPYSFGPMGIMS